MKPVRLQLAVLVIALLSTQAFAHAGGQLLHFFTEPDRLLVLATVGMVLLGCAVRSPFRRSNRL